ncbi:MAG: hypothetical protein HQ553_10035 [Chloroflexi bacterium]|nr:hypothetical protein [Chloroflexota bacterium]
MAETTEKNTWLPTVVSIAEAVVHIRKVNVKPVKMATVFPGVRCENAALS